MSLNLNYESEFVVDTATISHDDWLMYRRKGLGGSDASIATGVGGFKTMRELALDKRGLLPIGFNDDESDTERWYRLEYGNHLEPLLCKLFERKTGLKVEIDKKMYRHPLFPFMLADVDGIIHKDGKKGICEVKTTSKFNLDAWFTEGGAPCIPLNYELQMRHYLCVKNYDFAYIIAGYGNSMSNVIVRYIERDLAVEEKLIKDERYFWEEYVLAGRDTPAKADDDKKLYELAVSMAGLSRINTESLKVNIEGGIRDALITYLKIKNEYDAAKKITDELESKRNAARIPFIELLEGSTSATLISMKENGTNYTVSFTPTKDKVEINGEKLSLLYPEAYETCKEIKPGSRRFTLKEEKPAKEKKNKIDEAA